MAIVTGRDLGQALCKVFGVKTGGVSKITIESSADAIARVTIEHFVTKEQAEGVAKVLSTYALVDYDLAMAERDAAEIPGEFDGR